MIKRLPIIPFYIFFFLCIGLNGTIVYGDTPISGNIMADTTWSKANSPYIVTGTVQVFINITLTIEPGVTIKFNPSTGLTIGGKLLAIGTEESTITFTSNASNPTPGDWGLIKFIDTAEDASFDTNGNYLGGCIIKNSLIEFGKGIWCDKTSPFISSNHIRKTTNYGGILALFGTTASNNIRIVNNYFEENGIPISMYSADDWMQYHAEIPQILNNIIKNNDDGLLLNDCAWGILIKDNVIENNGGNNVGGISIRGGNASIISNVISNSYNSAIYCESAGCTVHSNQIIGNNYNGIELSGAYGLVTNNQIVRNVGYAVVIADGLGSTINFNEFGNLGAFEIYNTTLGPGSINASNNWWGTTDIPTIESKIYDYYDDITLKEVIYSPIATTSFFPITYVGTDGLCGGKSLCFDSIQNGLYSAESFTVIEITQETYSEDVIFSDSKLVTLQGGWDTNFTSSLSYTTINGSLTISGGTVIVENIILE